MLLARKLSHFQDLTTASQVGMLKADRRVQIKMPSEVVKGLDDLFPHVDRSHLLTELAIQAIVQQLTFRDRQVLREMAAAEQEGLDDMLEYLEERDAKLR